ncbi:MAG: nitrogen fixation negative regulator NifL [Methylocystaceae bacterium]|nr:nitrogen fixation negative regulator NifL [Methylocystaceae bacterium]
MQPTSNVAKERMAEALSAFMEALPEGVPQEVLDALGGSILTRDGILPPRLFYEVVEELAVAISIADANGYILYCNPTFENLSGYKILELIGKQHSLLSYKKTPVEVYHDLWHNITSGKKWNGTLLNKRKDGSPYLADLTVVPVFNGSNEVSYFIGIHRDVTETMELKRKLTNQKKLLESIIDDAPLIMSVLDENKNVIVENHGYKVLMADLDSQEPAEFFLDAVFEAIDSDFDTLKQKRRNFDNVEVRVDFEGNRTPKWYSCSGTWIESISDKVDHYYDAEMTNGLLLICNDITKRRYHFEQAKTNAIKALMAEKQMIQGISEVLNGAVFQLQGPLNLVSAASSMLERGASDPLTLRTMLKQVQETGEEALAKLKACIPHVSNEAKSSININELVREVLDITTEKFLTEGVMLNWQPIPVVPSITGQGNALRSLVKNLLDNAITAINEPGASGREITIATEVLEDDVVELIITDNGPGVCPEDRHKIFEPFFTDWKKASGKSGMGLAIVQQVLTEHDGTIDITPGFGGGARVRICLPVGENGAF